MPHNPLFVDAIFLGPPDPTWALSFDEPLVNGGDLADWEITSAGGPPINNPTSITVVAGDIQLGSPFFRSDDVSVEYIRGPTTILSEDGGQLESFGPSPL